MDNSIGIYIHIPFCKSKCFYCDFNSYSGKEYLAGPYFDALFSEMSDRAANLKGRPVRTVFIGGGTPSLVDPSYITRLLDACGKLLDINPNAEISMESNPGTLTAESLKAYRAAGVNRLSIGLQAWQDRQLESLGRIHRRQQYVDNLEAAYKAGFTNMNTDLIFGLPGQSFDDWAETLEAVTAPCLGSTITHLSCYSLQIEEGTCFGDRYEAGELLPADDELNRRMYRHTVEFLADRGYRHYELSNFAKPGFECRHNLIYWKAEEYAGFGAGAHSYLNHERFGNVDGVEEYIEEVQRGKDLRRGIETIGPQEDRAEFMILGLRLIDGVCAAEFEERFGESLESVYGPALDKLVREGLLEVRQGICGRGGVHGAEMQHGRDESRGVFSSGGYRLTTLGLDLANRVFVEFI